MCTLIRLNMKNNLSKRVQNIKVSAIRQMSLLAQSVQGALSLGQGIPDMKTPAYIREGVIELLNESDKIGKYSLQPGVPELKRSIANRLFSLGLPADPDKNICITTGAMEALAIVISSIVDEGDEVIVFDPGYPSHVEQILFAEGVPVPVPLDAKQGWKLNRKEFCDAITEKTKAVIVCSPSNPTGTIFEREDLDTIAELARQYGFFVICDQTYEFLSYEEKTIPSMLGYPAIRNNLILCSSFSKEFAMTGWRVGYLYAPEAILAEAMKVHDAFVICAPTISQYAALIALTGKPKPEDVDIKAELAKKREIICSRLDKLRDLFSYVKPQGAYYLLAKYKKTNLNSWKFALKMLKEARVISVPGSAFGSQGEGYIRFSYGASIKTIDEAFDRIEEWNKSL
ncbi:MAG: Aromatic amino acid aminotransferase [Parcubacteria group bacterium GW2011_GWA2_49_9]|nr:MAG: Aromatic amino acid aminotransferase [Parcubacteria group bacterium GW2011_GWA2_49_9]